MWVSKEKFAEAIIALGADEIQAMIDEDHGAEAVCSFCNNKYEYSEDELTALKEEALGGKTKWNIQWKNRQWKFPIV